MNTPQVPKEQLLQLYLSGKSMSEISQLLKCSTHKIAYWMDKYEIKRRSPSEATYVKRNPNGDPFTIKYNLTSQDRFLYGLGLGIYWGEGDRLSKNAVRVANSDPHVLKLFSTFLQEICGVKQDKIKYNLICFQDNNQIAIRKYWSKILKVPEERFGKIVQISQQGKGTYKRRSHFGVCILIVCNMKLKFWIMEQINNLKQPADIV